MTGFGVGGGALLAHSEGSHKQSENLAGLASLLEQARVSDDCFGPLFFYFKDKYADSLQECQGMAKQAAAYLEEISGAVRDTATAYGATESDNASGLADIDTGVGDLGKLNHAGDADRKSDFTQASTYGSSWADAGYNAATADASDPPAAAFAAFNARVEQIQLVTSPGQAFIDNGLGWLISIVISPLVNLVLEPALGDPEQMRSTAKGWQDVADWLNTVADHEDTRAQSTGPAWQGAAGDAFRAQMTEFGDGARAMSGDIDEIAGVLETAATIFDTFVQVVVDIIQELVLGLIIEWLAALAASWITFGASAGVATGLTATQSALTATRLGQKVAKLAHQLKPLITKLEDLLKGLRGGKLSGVMDKASQLRGAKVIGRRIKANPITNTASAFDNTRDAQRALDKANEAMDAARATGNSAKIREVEDGVLAAANKKMRNAADRRTTSTHTRFGKDATGEEALAQQVVKAGLGYLGPTGTTRTGTAVWRGTLENVPGAAVEWGAGEVYDHAADPSTPEERKAAQQRGFTTD
ncbi:WXG100 family type VII secretion target [Actinokineospora sp. NBRC 105648]|uniref:WXG100 family type VII secretion target n=1 Tax=Actinokineospora sp. NBRC 105648 TaxID=3032206 RepID=UPI0024A47636|nr:WXG100 family type VII secretion target [Actinokineospora sp. NBRC 105648]GLZ40653.1 hypothetical protein Acsp05_42770 [Actinokineospora sp. NBRC 105648]